MGKPTEEMNTASSPTAGAFPKMLTLDEVQEILNLGKPLVYALVKNGELRAGPVWRPRLSWPLIGAGAVCSRNGGGGASQSAFGFCEVREDGWAPVRPPGLIHCGAADVAEAGRSGRAAASGCRGCYLLASTSSAGAQPRMAG